MAVNHKRQREEARELAKYEADCKEYKGCMYVLVMMISFAFACLITSFLVPRKPLWYKIFFLRGAVVFFLGSAASVWLITQKFAWFAFPQRPKSVEKTCADRFCPV